MSGSEFITIFWRHNYEITVYFSVFQYLLYLLSLMPAKIHEENYKFCYNFLKYLGDIFCMQSFKSKSRSHQKFK